MPLLPALLSELVALAFGVGTTYFGYKYVKETDVKIKNEIGEDNTMFSVWQVVKFVALAVGVGYLINAITNLIKRKK